jgi:hypothetical protein
MIPFQGADFYHRIFCISRTHTTQMNPMKRRKIIECNVIVVVMILLHTVSENADNEVNKTYLFSHLNLEI